MEKSVLAICSKCKKTRKNAFFRIKTAKNAPKRYIYWGLLGAERPLALAKDTFIGGLWVNGMVQ